MRPLSCGAESADAVLMIASAASFRHRYSELRMPVAIIAGEADKIVNATTHPERLHRDVPGSTLLIVPGAGHMVHYTAGPQIVAVIAHGCEHN